MSKRRSRAVWLRHVRAWKKSGLTRRQYGEANSLSPGQLSWWKWRLGSTSPVADGGRPPIERAQRREGRRTAAAPTFLQARLVDLRSWASRLGAVGCGPRSLEIVAGPPHVVRVQPGFDAELLRQVLSALEEQ